MSIEEVFADWFAHARELGFNEFRVPDRQFRSCALSGGVLDEPPAVGLYYYVAQDGEVYAGQTTQGRKRFLQHLKKRGDLACVAMKPAPRDRLKRLEADLIAAAQTRFPTRCRNIMGALNTSSEVPFDAIVSAAERLAFLSSSARLVHAEWRGLPLLEQKNNYRAAKLLRREDAGELLRALAIFIDRCIPKVAATEARFWSVTVLDGRDLLLRVNVGHQEVFTLEEGGSGKLIARLFAPKRMSLWTGWFRYYSSGSHCHAIKARALGAWLTDDRILQVRKLIVQLMRHTTPLNIGSHCPAIVRAAFGENQAEAAVGLAAP